MRSDDEAGNAFDLLKWAYHEGLAKSFPDANGETKGMLKGAAMAMQWFLNPDINMPSLTLMLSTIAIAKDSRLENVNVQ